ncbi:TetR/AcrR family transcriptional regulator [Methanobacterium oryzae]|uniref:TetR/AcrR family transcriptional regulator n=1 Tax=Methanobacterium oryzae TaxID=69540 RepID=UPI003D218C16
MKESKEKRINDITNAALEVFLKKGYENTTMEEIAKNAGLSKGGLYHYFKSKDMLLMFVNQKINENIENMVYKAFEMPSVKEGILYYIESYLKYWIEHPKETIFLFLSITKMLDNHELLEYYQQFMGDYMKYFEEAFEMGIQSGEFMPHNAKTSAITLVGALDGIISYMILDENLKLEEVVKHFEEKFIRPIVKS